MRYVMFMFLLILSYIMVVLSDSTSQQGSDSPPEVSSAGGNENWDFWCCPGSTEC